MSTTAWIVIIVLLVVIFGAAPRWGYSRNWGYAPSGLLGIALVVFVVLLLTNTIRL
jgi:hypothetical protein